VTLPVWPLADFLSLLDFAGLPAGSPEKAGGLPNSKAATANNAMAGRINEVFILVSPCVKYATMPRPDQPELDPG
jgi:hypothetical protein